MKIKTSYLESRKRITQKNVLLDFFRNVNIKVKYLKFLILVILIWTLNSFVLFFKKSLQIIFDCNYLIFYFIQKKRKKEKNLYFTQTKKTKRNKKEKRKCELPQVETGERLSTESERRLLRFPPCLHRPSFFTLAIPPLLHSTLADPPSSFSPFFFSSEFLASSSSSLFSSLLISLTIAPTVNPEPSESFGIKRLILVLLLLLVVMRSAIKWWALLGSKLGFHLLVAGDLCEIHGCLLIGKDFNGNLHFYLVRDSNYFSWMLLFELVFIRFYWSGSCHVFIRWMFILVFPFAWFGQWH